MKKILTMMVCFFMLFLVSCNNSKDKNDIMQFSETTKATSKTELTEKMSVTISTSENCGKGAVTVKHHNYTALKDSFDYRYAHLKEEEFFNMLNRNDKEGIKAMFSEKVHSQANFDKQIDVLFDYINESITDYEESLMCSGKDKSYGKTIKWDFGNTPIAITKSHRYIFNFNFIYKDEEEPQNTGIQTLCVWDEKFDEHWNEIFDSQEWPTKNIEEGCFCFSIDGNIIR